MSQRVRNVVQPRDGLNIGNDLNKFGEGTRRVVFQGIEQIIGVNEIKAFADNTVAQKLGAVTGNRVADNRDGDGHSRR